MGSPMGSGWMAQRSFSRDRSVTQRRLARGTTRRILAYARPYRRQIAVFLATTVASAASAAAVPLLLKVVIDDGVVPGDRGVVVWGAVAVAVLAVLDAGLNLIGRWMSARVGEGLIFDLRRQVFDHVQRQPVAFFTRTQTGSLVSRLNSDVVGAQQAFTGTLSQVVSNVVTLVLALGAMLLLSWQITVVVLVLVPLFLLPARFIGRKLADITRESMQLNAELSQTMTERFNVSGALLVKIFGRYQRENEGFSERAARVRDIGVVQALYARYFFIGLSFLASFATALVYGVGGWLAVDGTLQVGTLVALAALLTRLYGPLTALSNVQVDIMTALVSFERVFEVLDLKPMVADSADARPLPVPAAATSRNGAPDGGAERSDTGPLADTGRLSVELDDVWFRYPSADEVSLASLESAARPGAGGNDHDVLRGVSFRIEPGQLVALVGPSGAGKTTITGLVARLYDPTRGVVRVGGRDVRETTLESLHDAVGVVTQDAHMFHDTVRANLAYARPEAGDAELFEAADAAQIGDLIRALPDGLDTVVGDRGYRLSGGEKQRLAIARLLLKAPQVVVLDEATAHLDSESEAAVQRALKTALTGRTSLVIAHRLSTVRDADSILVVEAGRIVERGTHEQLLLQGGLYAELYRTQFATQEHASS
ncbi:ABC transporter ATP-binding protein [Phytoactinopolyspora halotolerans]|uniref:ABC transporter ATP-binding protein n=1 Tax=Phytoactinopolyspora halotolerans TaxID=1981512 RepID=A0A6L9SHF7_9ACTN|nr:ABC transporter ATP-binding protein [Phytoactinopolyspora halotolerans]NEE04068.1 ABC transporter ATP-binding protein [Phytoactinopolyspora halotolerans]